MPPKKNGFMMFVNEWRRTNAQRRNLNLQQAVNCCGEIWTKMNAQQRGPYNASAKEMGRSKEERRDCHGQSLSAVEKEMREADEMQMQLKRNIERIVLKSKAEHDLENAQFIFVAFNYFTKALSTDVYIPAEFAACQYSIKSGKTSIYSSKINPGQIIFGQESDAQNHTSTTHQLPLPPNALGESDMGKLYSNILEYLRGCDFKSDRPLIVYTRTELMSVVKSCFRYLESDSTEKEGQIEVYDLQYLFYVLKREVMEIADLPQDKINRNLTDNMFQNDFFEYQMGISCQFHEDNDRSKYCAQSMVSRWCFVFSDFLCEDLAIKRVPGKHMPPEISQMFTVTNSGFTESMQSESSSVSSFQSVRLRVKPEVQSDYVPTDHSAFSSDILCADEFPSLGGRRAKPQHQSKNSAWNVPPLHCGVKDFENLFNMPRT